ncbi:MAG: hypothetical protein WCF17_06360 [Terracidiphilus sp.]
MAGFNPITEGKPEDFRAATISVEHGSQGASAVLLPIVNGN